MEQSFKEELAELIKDVRPAIYVAFNDGTENTFNYRYAKSMYNAKEKHHINGIVNSFTMATYYLVNKCDFDFLQSVMKIGLVFDIKDVEQNHIKPTAKPIENIVYYEMQPVKVYLNGERVKNADSTDHLTTTGFMDYNEFVSLLEQKGIEYDGPQTFEEFYYNILCNVPFDITLSVDIKNEKEKALSRRLY